jgi:type IV pilus assembly protein PilM
MQALDWITMNPKTQPIGLDIGHRNIKMVQVAPVSDRIKVLAARKVPLDPDLACDSPERQRAVVLAIKQVLADSDFRGRGVISLLPIDRIKITSLRLAEVEAAEAEEAIRREAAERFGLDPRRDAIHYLFAGNAHQGDEVKNEYILLAVDNATIGSHIALLEEAGLTPVGIDAPPCAVFRTFERTMRRQEDKEKTIIILDVGYRYTIVVFGRAGEICFAKHIPLGTGHFNAEIASVLGVAAADAEVLRHKLRRDEPLEAATRRHVIDALNTTAEQLASEIALCLRYYTVTFRGKRVERAVIAGGGAYEQVLLDVLRRQLSLEIEVAEPLRGLDLGEGVAGRELENGSADLALAVGLSLKLCHASALVEEPAPKRPEPVLEGESL